MLGITKASSRTRLAILAKGKGIDEDKVKLIQQVFQQYDTKNTGEISPEQVLLLNKSLFEGRIKEKILETLTEINIKAFDYDHSGKISLDEFLEMFAFFEKKAQLRLRNSTKDFQVLSQRLSSIEEITEMIKQEKEEVMALQQHLETEKQKPKIQLELETQQLTQVTQQIEDNLTTLARVRQEIFQEKSKQYLETVESDKIDFAVVLYKEIHSKIDKSQANLKELIQQVLTEVDVDLNEIHFLKEQIKNKQDAYKKKQNIVSSSSEFIKSVHPYRTELSSFLNRVSYIVDSLPESPLIFISYAWETDMEENQKLQDWLLTLTKDLEHAGMEVMLDIRNMLGNINKYMEEGLKKCTCALLILTPRLAERSTHVGCNLCKELDHINEKKIKSAGKTVLVPLLKSGDPSKSIPKDFTNERFIDFIAQKNEEEEHRYIHTLAGVEPELGLIPTILQLGSVNQSFLRWYKAEYINLLCKLEKIDLERK